jgi:hypothetical protein
MDRDKATTSSGDYEGAITQPHFLHSDASENATLVELIDQLQKVDVNAPMAQENAISISDNNGGRIVL